MKIASEKECGAFFQAKEIISACFKATGMRARTNPRKY
jgi:hypothetical protein